jgi:hypothetical protein
MIGNRDSDFEADSANVACENGFKARGVSGSDQLAISQTFPPSETCGFGF